MRTKSEDTLAAELAHVKAAVRNHVEYLDHDHMRDIYRQCGCIVDPGRWNPQTDRVLTALADQEPLSVIRIGDGEVHLLAQGERTPHLDRKLLELVLAQHSDTLELSDKWAVRLRQMMLSSIASADIVGVRGIDPAPRLGDVSRRVAAIDRDLRGGVGMFRAIDTMLELARQGLLEGKVVASAHLYFGFLSMLRRFIEASTGVLCITSRPAVVGAMAKQYKQSFSLIETGRSHDGRTGQFLQRVRRELPSELRGWLCLVGAGVWAEFYCDWIRERGGVAVDIGSGFDLLAGEQTRPVHKRLLGSADARWSVLAGDPRTGDR